MNIFALPKISVKSASMPMASGAVSAPITTGKETGYIPVLARAPYVPPNPLAGISFSSNPTIVATSGGSSNNTFVYIAIAAIVAIAGWIYFKK